MALRQKAWRLAAALPAALVLLAAPAGAEDKADRCLRVANVEPYDFLNIRAETDHESKIMGAIRPGHVEPLVLEGPCVPRTVRASARWCPVTYYVTRNAVRRGYVKAFFTESVPCPPSLRFYRERGADATP